MKKTRKHRKGFSADDRALWERVRASVDPIPKREKGMADFPLKPQLDEQGFEHQRDQNALAGMDTQKPMNGLLNQPLPSPMPRYMKPSHTRIELKTAMPSADISGLQRSQQRAIRRGAIEPSARLDLHGLRFDPARERLGHFLAQSAKQGHGVVLVITGKGGQRRTTDDGVMMTGVIRRGLPEWIHRAPNSHLVSHYCPAHRRHGGDGAWYIFIRANARRSARSGR